MTPYDNEIYRAPPDAAPTLEQDLRPAVNDIYIVESQPATAQQDVPATQETTARDSAPAGKRSGRIAKAMKLLASCTAVVVMAATLSAPLSAPPKAESEALHRWPYFGPVGDDAIYSFNALSENSQVSQASIGGKSFRLTAQREDLHLQWHESYDVSEDGSTGGFFLNMESSTEFWSLILDFSVHPQLRMEPDEGLGQVQTAGADTLYVRAFFIGGLSAASVSAQDIVDNLSDYIQISDAIPNGWGNVCIGETMYSTTSSDWNGLMSISPWMTGCNFDRICYSSVADYSLDSLIAEHQVNGIHWSFYYSLEKGALAVWAVPDQEDIAFAYYDYQTFYELGLSNYDSADQLLGSAEIRKALDPVLQRTVEDIIASGLSHYYLMP